MDVATFNKTEGVLQTCRENNITPGTLIPLAALAFCNRLVNRSFKALLRELTELHICDAMKTGLAEKKDM